MKKISMKRGQEEAKKKRKNKQEPNKIKGYLGTEILRKIMKEWTQMMIILFRMLKMKKKKMILQTKGRNHQMKKKLQREVRKLFLMKNMTKISLIRM